MDCPGSERLGTGACLRLGGGPYVFAAHDRQVVGSNQRKRLRQAFSSMKNIEKQVAQMLTYDPVRVSDFSLFASSHWNDFRLGA